MKHRQLRLGALRRSTARNGLSIFQRDSLYIMFGLVLYRHRHQPIGNSYLRSVLTGVELWQMDHFSERQSRLMFDFLLMATRPGMTEEWGIADLLFTYLLHPPITRSKITRLASLIAFRYLYSFFCVCWNELIYILKYISFALTVCCLLADVCGNFLELEPHSRCENLHPPPPPSLLVIVFTSQ